MAAKSDKPRRRGRPSKYTAELGAAIVKHVREGNFKEVAAAAHGVHVDTLYDWQHKGEEMEPTFDVDETTGERILHNLADFSEAIKKAWADAEISDVAQVAAQEKGWTRFAWRLERRNRERWAAKWTSDTREFEAFAQAQQAGDEKTDLTPELGSLRVRLRVLDQLIMQGGTAATPLDKLLELQGKTIELIRATVASQHKINPHGETDGDFRISLEVTDAAKDYAPTEANRVPDLEARHNAEPEDRAVIDDPKQAPVVGGTGSAEWDEVTD